MTKLNSLFLRLFLIPLSFVLFIPTSFALPLSTSELLKALIRIDTTNPPGNEIQAAKFVQQYLRQFRIDSQIIESAPGRANLVARLKGSGQKEPVLLLGHLDVVTAHPGEWKFPPFEARIDDGFLYGRGSIDMKGMVAMEIAAFAKLKAEETSLAGDVILALVADEEAGGKYGAEFLIEKHWDKVAARFVFNEGSIGLMLEGIHLYPIQVAEKGVAWMKLTVKGTSGHGSMPSGDNAVVILTRALDRLTKQSQPITRTAIVDAMLKRLAAHYRFPKSFLFRHFFDWPFRNLAQWLFGKKIEREKILNALLRNTVVPTVLKAGSKTNVIPGEAEALLDCRILPGETPEGFRDKLEKKISRPGLTLELTAKSLPNQSPFDTLYFTALEQAIRAQNPEAMVVPYISPGATDNRFFRAKGAIAYGIIPALIPIEDLDGLHGKNERIAVEQLAAGEQIILDLVKAIQFKD